MVLSQVLVSARQAPAILRPKIQPDKINKIYDKLQTRVVIVLGRKQFLSF